MNQRPKFLVLSGDGINCEHETRLAIEFAGGHGTIMHVNELLKNKYLLKEFHGLVIPGGFSFGDELKSGRVLALKLKKDLNEELLDFIDSKKPVLGICNGFQVLDKLGLINPKGLAKGERHFSLTNNKSGHFIDKWVGLKVCQNCNSPWLKNMKGKEIELPIRHGEGRIIFKNSINTYGEHAQVVMTYTEDVNGSEGKAAALTDSTGLVLGMMPHPEAYISQITYRYKRDSIFNRGQGVTLFENMVTYLYES